MNQAATLTGKRAAATAVDCLILYIPYVIALSDSMPEAVRVAAAGAVIVLIGVQARLLTRRGQTIGKILWRHRVVSRKTGKGPGFLVGAVARPLVSWVPNLACLAIRSFPVFILIDALVLNWRADGLSLHDLICGTRVVDEAVV